MSAGKTERRRCANVVFPDDGAPDIPIRNVDGLGSGGRGWWRRWRVSSVVLGDTGDDLVPLSPSLSSVGG